MASSSSSNNEVPVSHHRPTSASMLDNVTLSIRVCRLARTVTIIPRRFAPDAVLLVRAPLRISASRRALRSLRLLVGSTSGCSTNTNKQSTLFASSRCRRMQHQLDRFANQMSPAQLMFAEHTFVSRVVVGHADTGERFSRNVDRFGLLSRNSAPKQNVHRSRKYPRISNRLYVFAHNTLRIILT